MLLDEFGQPMDASGPVQSPAALAAAKTGLTDNPFAVASMGFSILGGLLKGMAAIQAGDYNARVSRQNAGVADAAATDAILRGQSAAVTARLRGGRLEGQQKAALAGSGVQVNAGSALDLLNDTSMMSDLDARTIASNAAREAWGYQSQASQFRQKALMDEAAGKAALGESILGGIQGAAGIGAKALGFA